MRFIFKIVLLYLTVASFFSCDKADELEFVYLQTQCADVWDTSAQNTIELFDPEVNFENFMAAEGIAYSNYSFEQINEGNACLACTCLTGFEFKITVSDEHEADLINLGFTISE